MVALSRAVACLAVLLCATGVAAAPAEMTVQEARSVSDLGTPSGPNAIRFSDRQAGDTEASLVPFASWGRDHPEQKRLLSLFPAYAEPTVTVKVDGLRKTRDEKLTMYVAGARLLLDRPADSVDLGRLATLSALARIDPAIRHRPITAADAIPNRDPEQPYNKRPDRAWCEGANCFESRYDLEGKIPLGVRLANKLEEGGKKIADHVTFQSEIRPVPPAELEEAGVARLTGIATPVASGLEQSTFQVNQILRFGKLLAVVQPAPADAGRALVSIYLALAVKADVLDRKKEYERVPVLRNLVPSQVLMGTSSFNTGTSLSAGLPVYARSRIRTLAGLLAGS